MGVDNNLKIYDFFLWEYQRRNQKYRDDFDHYLSVREHHINELPFQDEFKEEFWKHRDMKFDILRLFAIKDELISREGIDKQCRKKIILAKRNLYVNLLYFTSMHGIQPKNYKDGQDSKLILKKAIAKDQGFFLSYSDIRYPKIKSKVIRANEVEVEISINLANPIRQILAEVEKIYYDQRTSNESDDFFGKGELVFESWSELRKISIRSRSGQDSKKKRVRADILPRACGLFLHEYCRENKCKKIDALNYFSENIVQQVLGFPDKSSYTDTSTLLKYMDNANMCIRNVEIIPIK